MAIVFITKEKTNWRYLAIVFILGVIVGSGTLWLSQNWTIPITQLPEIKKAEKPPQDETADWKTYRNEKYRFEFKYPSFFILEQRDERNFLLKFVYPDYENLNEGIWAGGRIYNAKDYGVYHYEESGYIIYDILTKKWYLKDQYTFGEFDPSSAKKIKEYSPKIHLFTKDDIPVYGPFWFSDVGLWIEEYAIIHEKEQLIIEFFLGLDGNQLDIIESDSEKQSQLIENISKAFDQMLSTFQFIE